MKTLPFAAFLAVLGFSTLAMGATTYTLTDANSVVKIEADSSAGLKQWTVDGVDQVFQRWFWYRVGDTGPELSLDTLSAPTVTPLADQVLVLVYANAQFRVTLNYMLTGGDVGSGGSDVSLGISVKNLTSSPLALHLFDYADADLNGSAAGDTATVENPGRIVQTKGTAADAVMVSSLTPSHTEAATYDATLTSLTDTGPTTLSDNASAGPGDATMAMQWDLALAAKGSKTWSEDMTINGVPEPATLALLAFGGMGVYLSRKRR